MAEEWEPGIPIWCEACQLRLNGPGQWKDHVGGEKHRKNMNKPAPHKKESALTFKGSREDLHRTISHLQLIVMDLEDNIAGNPDPEWIHSGVKLDGTHPAPMWSCCKKMYTCDCDGNGHPTPPHLHGVFIVSSPKMEACHYRAPKLQRNLKYLVDSDSASDCSEASESHPMVEMEVSSRQGSPCGV